MPPKKVVDASKVATGDEGTPAKEIAFREGINIEDLNLPKSIVTRLAKGALPPNTQIQGNAMLAMSKSATVFVNYLASHANEHAHASNRKTIAPQDVFNALEDLEFPDFRPRLEAELAKFNDIQADKRNAYKSKVANKAAAGAGDDSIVDGEGETQDREGQPAAKKAKLDPDDSAMADASEIRDHNDDEAEDGQGEDQEDEDEDEEAEREERLQAEEQSDDAEQKEVEDEALDNGEDSD